MNKQLEALLKKINKDYGEETIGVAKDLKYLNTDRISSGSLFLDWALGTNDTNSPTSDEGGFPMGKLVELYGKESSGKTLITLKTIAGAQKKGLNCMFIDSENAFQKDFAELHGVNTEELVLTRESKAEKVFDILADVLQDGSIKVVVVDSVASLVPEKELDESTGQILMAPLARVMSKGLRKLNTLNKGGALIIFINQLRENPGAYGNPNYTPGGRALAYYASVRVEVRAGEPIKEDKEQIGHEIKFKVSKNKTAPPKRDGYFKFKYYEGIDQIDELVSLGLIREKITRKGAYYYLQDLENGYQGRDNLEKALEQDEQLLQQTKLFIYGDDE